MQEIWKDINGYEGHYQISSLGRIKSLSREKTMPNGTICFTKERILNPSHNKSGYYSLNLYKNGERINHFVHRLVANAFISNPNNLPEVNHIKEFEKFNNTIENLEWCDKIYNNNYGTKKERQGKNRSKNVYQYDKHGNLIKIIKYDDRKNCDNFSIDGISKCCSGVFKTYKGCFWSYEEKTKEQIINIVNSNKNLTKVIQKTVNGDTIKVWNSIKDVVDSLNLSSCCISDCCRGKQKTSGGYIWEYYR